MCVVPPPLGLLRVAARAFGAFPTKAMCEGSLGLLVPNGAFALSWITLVSGWSGVGPRRRQWVIGLGRDNLWLVG